MSLKDHPYRFFGTGEGLSALWQPTLNWMQGQKLVALYGVWDRDTGLFWQDLPLLARFEAGVLMIHYRRGIMGGFALGWNEMLPEERPLWPAETRQRYAFDEEDERQNLAWKERPESPALAGQALQAVELLEKEGRLAALGFLFAEKSLFLPGGQEMAPQLKERERP